MPEGKVWGKCPQCKSRNPESSVYCNKCASLLTQPDDTLSFHPEVPAIPEADFAIGTIFKGKYKLIEKLGGGGMGVVYKAEDMRLKRHVAIKFLPSRLTKAPEFKQRFIQEAQAASVLEHPNICTIHEIDETKEGQMYISMAFYPGESLKKKIARAEVPLNHALDCVTQIAQGLTKAHSQGIVHRDIKPANVMATSEGIMKIVDFGLAKLTSQTKLTTTPSLMGTPSYMSPEQAQGESVDHRTDIWALGVVFYELLTRELPFKGENVQAVLFSIINKSPLPPSDLKRDIPDEVERIVLKCLRKKSEDRYQSADRLLSDLAKLKKTLESEKYKDIAGEKKKVEAKKETERRQATVMLAEISGYSEILENLDPEEAALFMNRIFVLIGSIFEKYDARIDKITGGNLLAIFGIPKAIEDAPKKAINAAIELRNSLIDLNKEGNLQIPLDIHVGINTGVVIAGMVTVAGKKEISVFGEAVNLASGLKDSTPRGMIYVGQSTYRPTKNDFDYRKLKPLVLEGKKEPVPVYELLSKKEKVYRAPYGADRMIHSEMVGRDKELAKLELHVLKAINNEGSIVNIIGEAGIGKSRLIAELKKIEALKKVTLLEGRALSIGRNLSFHPIIDFMKNWSGVKEEDSKAESIKKLEKAIKNVYPEGADEVFPFIATLMGMKLTGIHEERLKGVKAEALEKLILKSLKELISKGAEQSPLVFIIEDLHWADLTSLEFLESLYRLAEDNRILFVNVMRPDYKETGERLLKTIRRRYGDISTEIVLESLNENQSEALVSNLLKIKAFPARTRDLITMRAEGNPFFIEEIVRSFIDSGVVEIRDGNFRVTEKIDSVVIPQTIDEVLMARIDKLEEGTKLLLKLASVIGRNFFYKILAEVGKSIGEIDDKLEFLKEVQLVIERRRMEELEYLFKHALAQEAVYDSILLKKRKELHRNVALAIESVFKERLHEFYGMLTIHFSLGDDLDKAEEYLIKAGEEALKSSASGEALHYYQEALNIYLNKHGDAADPGKIAMLEKNIALAFFNKGQYVEAVEYFNKTLAFSGEKLPKNPVSIMFKFLAGFLYFLVPLYFPSLIKKRIPQEKDKEIIDLFEKKIRALSAVDPKKMFIQSFYWLKRLTYSDYTKIETGPGVYVMSSGLFCYSGISFRLSKRILESVKDKIEKNDVRSMLYYKFSDSMHHFFTGEWDKVGEYDENLESLNLRIGAIWLASNYALYNGYLQLEQGNYSGSQEFVNRLFKISHTYEDDYSRSMKYLLNTKLLMKYRKLKEAVIETEDGIEYLNKLGYKELACSLYSYKARIKMIMGDINEAEELLLHADRILSYTNSVPVSRNQFFISRFTLDIYLLEESIKSGNKKESARIRKTAAKTGRKTFKLSQKVAAQRTETQKLMGIFHWLSGKQKKALKSWRKSIKFGQMYGAKLELSRTYMEVGKRLLEKKGRFHELNGITAQHYLEKAKALFEEMDLRWDLEELAKITSEIES